MNSILAVFIGGGLGSLCRYVISRITVHYFSGQLPLATLLSNLISSLVLAGFISIYGERMGNSPLLSLFVLVGFCGGFSTFSTFSYETFILLKSADYLMAFLNIFISVLLALAIMFLVIKNL